MDLARLKVIIDGDNKGALAALRETDRKMDQIGGSASRMSGAFGLAARAIAASTVAATGAVAGFGLKMASDNEQATISFNTLLGSADKAQKFMSDLNEFAATTPFELPGLRTAASRLIAAGTAAEDVIPLLTAVGDATSGMGTGSDGIERAVAALQKMQVSGKVTAETMMQLTEAGVPAWDALASKLGVTVAQAQDKVTKGAVAAGDVYAAIADKAGPSFKRLDGMMAKQSQSLAGLVSTLKDTVSQKLAASMEPAVNAIKNQLPGVTNAIGAALDTIAPQMAPLIGSLASAFSAILPALAPVLSVVSQLMSQGLGALAELVATVLAPALTNLQPLFNALTEAFGILASAIGPALQPIIEALVEGLNMLAPVLPTIATFIAKLAVALGGALGKALQKMLPMLPDLAEQLIKVAEEALPPLLDAVVALTPVLVFLTEMFTRGLGVALVAIAPLIKLTAEGIRGIAMTLGALFTANWGNIWNKATEVVANAFNGVVDFFQGLPSAIANVAGDIWDPIANAFIDMLNMIIRGWNSLDFKLPSYGGMHIGDTTIIPGWEGSTLGVPDIPEIPRFHTGGVFNASGGEGLALLRSGEVVFTPAQMKVLGQAIGGGGATGSTIHLTSSPTLRIEGSIYADDMEMRLKNVLDKHDRDLLGELTARGVIGRR
jgi:tape measure domain-containing protein